MTESEKQTSFSEKLKSIYLDSNLADHERRHRIYNLCILQWQSELSLDEISSRWEVSKFRVLPNGELTPDKNSAKTGIDKKRKLDK